MGYLLRDFVSKLLTSKISCPQQGCVLPCPTEPEGAGWRCEAMTLKGILCGRGWAVGKEARDQDQGLSGCFLVLHGQ